VVIELVGRGGRIHRLAGLDARTTAGCYAWGVEGTGAYGAGLTRLLRGEGVDMIEVERPDRTTRRLYGKSDPIDAIAAAQAGLAAERTGTPSIATAAPKPCATCGWPGAARSTNAPTPNAPDQTLIVTAPTSCVPGYAA
jgi:hypothetical protein